MERSCRRRCRRADDYDSGGRTLVVVIFGSCLGFGIDSRFQHFPFQAGLDGHALGGCFQHIPRVNHA